MLANISAWVIRLYTSVSERILALDRNPFPKVYNWLSHDTPYLTVVYAILLVILGRIFLQWILTRSGITVPSVLRSVKGKHVFITGGSSGIGKALAVSFLQRGANVTIAARTASKLDRAIKDIHEQFGRTTLPIHAVAMDTTKVEDVKKSLDTAEKLHGIPVTFLVACAGTAKPGYFISQPLDDFEFTMKLNYLGTVLVCREVASRMIQRGDQGSITCVSSGAGLIGFIGYSSYSPTKFAVRGFAEAIRNELKGFGIHVHLSFPPDTETPGFAKENETKPKECKEVFDDPPYSAASVAESMVNGIMKGLFHLPAPDPIQTALASACSGVTPRGYPILEAFFSPLLFLAMSGFSIYADWVAGGYAQRLRQERKQK
eukprot:g2810.t1